MELQVITNDENSEQLLRFLDRVFSAREYHTYKKQIDLQEEILRAMEIPCTYEIYHDEIESAAVLKTNIFIEHHCIGSILNICRLDGE